MNNHLKFFGDKIEGPVTIIQYPDKQRSIILNLHELNKKQPIYITARIRHFEDLELLSCLVSALNINSFYIDKIYFVYLCGVRSDRPFSLGEPSYFRDVISPILESYNTKIWLLWPFIPLACAHKLCKNLISYSCGHWMREDMYNILEKWKNLLIIAGDESAKEHYILNNEKPLYFIKKRINGEFDIKLSGEYKDEFDGIVIVDDLCDAGGTFIAEAQYLREKYPDIKLKLFVYHGLFTKGLDPLLKYFDEIICTNSYQDINHPQVTQIKVI
jgi:hypothetical protein